MESTKEDGVCCLWFVDFREGGVGEGEFDLNNLLSVQSDSKYIKNPESPLILHTVFCVLDLTSSTSLWKGGCRQGNFPRLLVVCDLCREIG